MQCAISMKRSHVPLVQQLNLISGLFVGCGSEIQGIVKSMGFCDVLKGGNCPKKNKYLRNSNFTGESKNVLYFQCKLMERVFILSHFEAFLLVQSS